MWDLFCFVTDEESTDDGSYREENSNPSPPPPKQEHMRPLNLVSCVLLVMCFAMSFQISSLNRSQTHHVTPRRHQFLKMQLIRWILRLSLLCKVKCRLVRSSYRISLEWALWLVCQQPTWARFNKRFKPNKLRSNSNFKTICFFMLALILGRTQVKRKQPPNCWFKVKFNRRWRKPRSNFRRFRRITWREVTRRVKWQISTTVHCTAHHKVLCWEATEPRRQMQTPRKYQLAEF